MQNRGKIRRCWSHILVLMLVSLAYAEGDPCYDKTKYNDPESMDNCSGTWYINPPAAPVWTGNSCSKTQQDDTGSTCNGDEGRWHL